MLDQSQSRKIVASSSRQSTAEDEGSKTVRGFWLSTYLT